MRILLVLDSFPPDHTIGARRWGLLAGELAKRHRVTILKMSGIFKIDEKASVPQGVSDIIEVPYRRPQWQRKSFGSMAGSTASQIGSKSHGGERKGLKAALGRFAKVVRFYITFPSTTWKWAEEAVRQIEDRAKNGEFDVVIASSPSISCIRVAERIHRMAGTPWVADFRDPFAWYCANPYPDEGWIHRRVIQFERQLLRTAAAVTAVNSELLEFMAYDGKKVAIRNPAKEPPRGIQEQWENTRPREGKLRLCYAGTMGERYLGEELFSFLAEAKRRGLDFELTYCGASSTRVNSLIEQFGMEDVVKDLGLLPVSDVGELMRKADVLILLSMESRAIQFFETGKIVEYLFSGRPILAISNKRGDAMRRILKETGAGWSVTDSEGFMNVLESIRKGELPERNIHAIREYLPERAVLAVENLLDQVTAVK